MTTFPNGIHLNIPADVYHAANGVSNSMLANMDPPARLPVYLSKKREVTPYMRLGTLIHHAILEPDKIMPRILIQPETYITDKGEVKPWHNGAAKCKEWHAAAKLLGEDVLTRDQYDALRECVRALESDELVANSLAVGDGEVSVFADLKLPSGRTVTRRCRLDWVRRGQCAYDIKKVGEGKADRWEFAKLARDRRYFVQAAYYMDAWNAVCDQGDPYLKEPFTGYDTEGNPWHFEDWDGYRVGLDHGETIGAFCFFVVEDTAPYLVQRYEIKRDSAEHFKARDIYTRDLETYAECVETGVWPGYKPGFQELKWPREWSKE